MKPWPFNNNRTITKKPNKEFVLYFETPEVHVDCLATVTAADFETAKRKFKEAMPNAFNIELKEVRDVEVL